MQTTSSPTAASNSHYREIQASLQEAHSKMTVLLADRNVALRACEKIKISKKSVKPARMMVLSSFSSFRIGLGAIVHIPQLILFQKLAEAICWQGLRSEMSRCAPVAYNGLNPFIG